MSKKVMKHKKVEITLEPDGFSIHTFELSRKLTKVEWKQCKQSLYEERKQSGGDWIHPDKDCEGRHDCARYSEQGIRIRLEDVRDHGESKGYYVRMVVNPRKLIYPNSNYLGILPPNEESVELLEKAFRSVLKKSPFERDIRKYYLSRVDLCTNIRCENEKVFRELVRLLRKTATPEKYKRKLYRHRDKKKANQYNKHYIRIACDSQELVIYDKTYQLDKNGLTSAYEKLPSSVLRIEVHYMRNKLRQLEKQIGDDDPLELLNLLIRESKPQICKLVKQCYPDLEYRNYEEGVDTIKQSSFSKSTKKRMLTLLEQMQRKQTIDAAFHWMEKHGMKTDDLLKKFEKIGINPIPLCKEYAAARIPSLYEILHTVDGRAVLIEIAYWKWK